MLPMKINKIDVSAIFDGHKAETLLDKNSLCQIENSLKFEVLFCRCVSLFLFVKHLRLTFSFPSWKKFKKRKTQNENTFGKPTRFATCWLSIIPKSAKRWNHPHSEFFDCSFDFSTDNLLSGSDHFNKHFPRLYWHFWIFCLGNDYDFFIRRFKMAKTKANGIYWGARAHK